MRWARRHRRLTIERLARAAGLGTDTLRKKEKGVNPFYLEEISRLCDILDAPSIFPFLDWGEARTLDRQRGMPDTPP